MGCVATVEFTEESTAVVTMAFTDAADDAVIPSSINWSLLTCPGAVVNSRDEVVIGSPAASVSVTLSGDDLAMVSGADSNRAFVIKAVYSSTEGSNLPLNAQLIFSIAAIIHVP